MVKDFNSSVRCFMQMVYVIDMLKTPTISNVSLGNDAGIIGVTLSGVYRIP